MTISVDWLNLVVESDASILDLPAFKDELRALEASDVGVLYPSILTYKRVDLGGAYFHAVDFINGWQVKFPAAGNYTIQGNLNAAIVPVAGVYVERKTSAAFATTATGGSGPSTSDIAAAVWGHATATDLVSLVGVAHAILRNKTITDPTTGAMTVYADDGITPLLVCQVYEDVGAVQTYRGQGANRRERLT